MRTVFSFLIVLFLVSTFNTTLSFAQEPPQVQLLRHPEGVLGLAYSPDSATILTGGLDGKARLWDVETGTVRLTLEHPNVDGVSSVAYSPDGTMVATGNRDWKVRLWDTETGAIIHTLIGHNFNVRKVAFSPDGNTIASLEVATLIIWDVATGTRRHTIERTNTFEYSPDRATLATIDVAGDMNIWDLATGTRRNKFRTDVGIIVYSPDGTTLAKTTTLSNNVDIWDPATGRLLHTLIGHTNSPHAVYSPDSLRLVSGADTSVRVWDVATGGIIDVLPSDQNVEAVGYSRDGTMIAAGSFRRDHLVIWDANTLTRRHVLRSTSCAK